MYFTICKKTGKVRLYEFDRIQQKSLPRSKSMHLDGQPAEVIQNFINQFNKPKIVGVSNETLTDHVIRFCKYERDMRKLDPSTIKCKEHLLLTYVIPYFLSVDAKDPNKWGSKCVKLVDYLINKKLSQNQIVKCNVALTGLWSFMQDEQIVYSSMKLRLRKPLLATKADTPLQFTLTPEDVIKFASNAEPDMAFLALTGYFFSLRTQETLALTRNDFRAGGNAASLECCKVFKKNNLFDKFAVNIEKQKSKSLKINNARPKSGSKGWVACFNETAAKMIIANIKEIEVTAAGEPLVRFSVDHNIKRWRSSGIKGITLKDLRRASIYWLGHYSDLGLIELKSHARHNKTDTTALYLRRPNESIATLDDLDLEA